MNDRTSHFFCHLPFFSFYYHTRLLNVWCHAPTPHPQKKLHYCEVRFHLKHALETLRHSDKRNTLYMYHSWGVLVRRGFTARPAFLMFFQGYLPTLKEVFFLVDADFLLNCGVSLLNKQTNTVQMLTGPMEARKRAERTILCGRGWSWNTSG